MIWSYDTFALLAWIAYFLFSTLGTARPRLVRRPPPAPGEAPRIAVLVPVRGIGPATRRFFELLMAQDYPHFRVLLLVESADDPAAELMAVPGMAARAGLVVAGEATDSSQKVANLLAGLRALEPGDEIVVLCDADTILPPDWLTRLTQPLRDGEVEVTTGFRLLLPTRPTLGACLYAHTDVALALSRRPPFSLYCWGGSTAFRAASLPRLDLETAWRGAYSDDLAFSEAARKARLKGRVIRDLLLPTDFDQGSWSATDFGRRQFLVLRLHMPLVALGAALVPALPFIFWLTAIIRAAGGSTLALYAMGIVFTLDLLRAWLRYDAVRRIAGPEGARRYRCAAIAGWALAPLYGPLSLLSAISVYLMHRVTWAGIRYELRGPRQVRVLERRPPGRAEARGPQR